MFKEAPNPNQKKSPVEAGFKSAEKIYQTIELLEDLKSSEDHNQEWIDKYSDNPTAFFNEKNFAELKNISPARRLLLLANASGYLVNSPEMVSKYYVEFPEDLDVIISIFIDNQGRSKDAGEFFLFSISAKEMEKKIPALKESFYAFEHYQGRADRKQYAPALLLKNFGVEYRNNFKRFGEAADGVTQALAEAEELATRMGDHFIDPNQIFTPAYEELSETEKADFLRTCLAEIQMYLVYHEVYDSIFTEERAREDEKRSKEDINIFGINFHHNVAHSMIYKTYQPSAVYNAAQEKFERTMRNTVNIGGAVEEYPFHRLAIVVLEKLQDIKEEKEINTEVAVDFWNKNRDPIFANSVASVLSKQDADKAARELLLLIQKENKDKIPLAAILHRLEFGKIGISQEGVKYLERVYDLAELNNPGYHANRLTSEGEVGIFDEELKLIKYFHLGDLSTKEKKVKAKAMDFVYETLFIGGPNETAEEKAKRLEYLEEFKKNYYQIAEDKIFHQTEVKLNNLSFREQGWFLIYFNQASEEEKERLRNFVKNYSENGIKVFLALESGEKVGGTILDISDNLKQQPEAARLLFSQFAQSAYHSEKTAGELCKIYNETFDEKQLNQDEIKETILRQSSELLMKASQALGQVKENDKPVMVKDLVNNFVRQKSAQRKIIEESKKIVNQINREFKDINKKAKYQKNLERKLEQIILGHESAALPQELLQSLPQKVSEIKPETMPKRGPLYFPVGISKDLPSWQKVEQGKMQAAKPIDIYSYLFWLQNQGRKAQLVVCDEIQTNNFKNLYDLEEEAGRQEARKIGEIEATNYRRIIETFGLNNIEVIGYQTFLKQSGENKIEKYKKLCEKLSNTPTWAKAFLSMAQESVGEQATKEEKEKYLPYAIEELSWILAFDGTKISHLNEARYDIIAAVIKNIENYATQQDKNQESLDEEEFNSILTGVLDGLNDFINKFKAKEERGSARRRYLDRAGELLKNIYHSAAKPPQNFNKKLIRFNFLAPNIGSASFGWRSQGQATESVIKFKEPYSTYFYQSGAELFLNSDQVVAAPQGEISGKIMTLEEKQQLKYAREIDLPMLAHYFKILEQAPESYFKAVGKTKNELLNECQESQTLTDLHRFIQRYIVEPSLKAVNEKEENAPANQAA